jgi:peptidylprolyl isomerase
MIEAKHGDTVKIHYRGTLHDGSEFETSYDREPLEFTIGEGQVISGLEEAILGMKPGDSKSTNVPAEKAFGPYREDLVGENKQKKIWALDARTGNWRPRANLAAERESY